MTRPAYRVARFLQSPIGRRIEFALWRFRPYKRVVSWLVWREISRDAAFMADLRQGMEDSRAGRMYRYTDDDVLVPSETWKPDDPQQPEGWRHDGSEWVRA